MKNGREDHFQAPERREPPIPALPYPGCSRQDICWGDATMAELDARVAASSPGGIYWEQQHWDGSTAPGTSDSVNHPLHNTRLSFRQTTSELRPQLSLQVRFSPEKCAFKPLPATPTKRYFFNGPGICYRSHPAHTSSALCSASIMQPTSENPSCCWNRLPMYSPGREPAACQSLWKRPG